MAKMTPTFNMKDLAEAVSEKFNVSHQDGAQIVRFAFDTIMDELADGKQVRLHQFGTLEARFRKAGQARNPSTGARVPVPARRVVKLTVSPALKAKIAEATAAE